MFCSCGTDVGDPGGTSAASLFVVQDVQVWAEFRGWPREENDKKHEEQMCRKLRSHGRSSVCPLLLWKSSWMSSFSCGNDRRRDQTGFIFEDERRGLWVLFHIYTVDAFYVVVAEGGNTTVSQSTENRFHQHPLPPHFLKLFPFI